MILIWFQTVVPLTSPYTQNIINQFNTTLTLCNIQKWDERCVLMLQQINNRNMWSYMHSSLLFIPIVTQLLHEKFSYFIHEFITIHDFTINMQIFLIPFKYCCLTKTFLVTSSVKITMPSSMLPPNVIVSRPHNLNITRNVTSAQGNNYATIWSPGTSFLSFWITLNPTSYEGKNNPRNC